MHATRIAAVVTMAAVLIGACTQTTPYRTETMIESSDGKLTDQICEITNAETYPGTCANFALVHHSYKYEVPSSAAAPEIIEGDYYLGFVEFDDQGWFADRKQMEVLLRLLYDGEKSKSDHEYKNIAARDYLIFVFAHGWRHNAEACDNNVVCFQRQLERLAILEYQSNKLSGNDPNDLRTVVGLYVGWRGLAANVQPFEILSFWDRKNTAQRVGLGGVNELLTRLNDFRRYKNKKREGDKTQLVIVGHSFGGTVIYSALYHNLLERAVWMERDKKGSGELVYSTANSFGDLVVLVNPAFEGAIYEPLHHIATNRCYVERQRPAMLVVTSKGDDATGVTFPLGRRLSNAFESTRPGAQERAVLNTVGHLARYKTHDLVLNPGVDPKWATKLDPSKCGCPHLKPTQQFLDEDWESEKSFLTDLNDIYNVIKETRRFEINKQISELKSQGKPIDLEQIKQDVNKKIDHLVSYKLFDERIPYGDNITMIRNEDYAPKHPYLVISTDKNIIPGHNEIYGEHFTRFLRRFYIRHIKAKVTFPRACYAQPACLKSDITPCERSCRRLGDGGASCSDRVPPKSDTEG